MIALLVFFEIRDYWTPTVSEELFVDTSRGPKLRINVDFVIPAISCECKLCFLLLYYIRPHTFLIKHVAPL